MDFHSVVAVRKCLSINLRMISKPPEHNTISELLGTEL